MPRHVVVSFIVLTGFFITIYLALKYVSLPFILTLYNKNPVPYIRVAELKNLTHPILFDTRELEEYRVSRIPGAIYAGNKQFSTDSIEKYLPDKNSPVIVYCSIGLRSNKIGKKLNDAGYRNVRNLWGGIFDWKNKGNLVVDDFGKPTEKIHAYSIFWGIFLRKGQKVF